MDPLQRASGNLQMLPLLHQLQSLLFSLLEGDRKVIDHLYPSLASLHSDRPTSLGEAGQEDRM